MNLFGGKLTGGIFAVIGAIIGIIMVGIMAAPFGTLVSYFDPAAEDTSDGSRFSRLFLGISGDTNPGQHEINTDTSIAGGSGWKLEEGTGGAVRFVIAAADSTEVGFTDTQDLALLNFYNEQGNAVTVTGTLAAGAGTGALGSNWEWMDPPKAFSYFNFLNSILVSLLALVAAIGLIMKTKNSYDAFERGGVRDLSPIVLREVTTLVLAVVAIYLAPTMLNVVGDTAQLYTSGQHDFSFVSTILKIVFAVIPTMIIVGLMTLVSGAQVQNLAVSQVSRVGRVVPRRRRRPTGFGPAQSQGV